MNLKRIGIFFIGAGLIMFGMAWYFHKPMEEAKILTSDELPYLIEEAFSDEDRAIFESMARDGIAVDIEADGWEEIYNDECINSIRLSKSGIGQGLDCQIDIWTGKFLSPQPSVQLAIDAYRTDTQPKAFDGKIYVDRLDGIALLKRSPRLFYVYQEYEGQVFLQVYRKGVDLLIREKK